jgi:hypothetical protein
VLAILSCRLSPYCWRLTGVGSRCFPRPLWPGKQGVAFLDGDMVEAFAWQSCHLSLVGLAVYRGN